VKLVSSQSARIAGIVSSIPRDVVNNLALARAHGIENPTRLIDAIGVYERRLAGPCIKISHLACHAAEYLLNKLGWDAQSIDGIIMITQSPDRRIPATACRLHHQLRLKPECFAFDINLGCSAYPYGLWMAQQLMNSEKIRRVLLVVGDLATRNNDPRSPGISFLFGDAATATALEVNEFCSEPSREDLVIYGTDGSGDQAIELGEYQRLGQDRKDEFPTYAAPILKMDGKAVTSFAISTVPTMINALDSARAKQFPDSPPHDFYLFHQANVQMLKHIAFKAGLKPNLSPINMDRYGNTASASIPLLITTDLAPLIAKQSLSLAMFGFGTGLSWSAISKTVGPLDVVATIEYPE
jgi:3-oxoacyl-[acyl-carrier-protein] synthase-3